MRSELYEKLTGCETDVENALQRFSGNEALYESCLLAFLKDKTIPQLEQALQKQSWDEAFTCVHALKGLAGNMGFIPLFHASAQLVLLIRQGKTKELVPPYENLKQYYKDITMVIKEYCLQNALPEGGK